MSTPPTIFPQRNPAGLWWIGGAIVLLTVLAYSGSFSGPFVFDDPPSIADNATIHHLWPLGPVFSPPTNGVTVTGRPILNLSLAVNYAFGGTNVRGYHVTNLCIHLLGALTLFGIVRRTFQSERLKAKFGEAALPLAGVVALLWSLHPVQTESVTYIIQRAESLAGLFYLLALYAFVRAVQENSARWCFITTFACWLGVGTKEIAVTAPMIIFLYDRTFFAGSLAGAWRARKKWHLIFGSAWLVQAGLLIHSGANRGGTMGFDLGAGGISFALTQLQAIAQYLALTWWPHPLVFDYGLPWRPSVGETIPALIVAVLSVAATIVAVRKWPAAGFAGVVFFLILAPTSLVPSTVQAIVEHRLYLPLAGLWTLTVAGLYSLLGRKSWFFFGAVALAFAALTSARNRDYRSEELLWNDTVTKRPESARAHNNLAQVLLLEGRTSAAIEHLNAAIALKPDYAKAHNNLGSALAHDGRLTEAFEHFEFALRVAPDSGEIHHNLGDALLRAGRISEAEKRYAIALQTQPELADLQENNLGLALLERDRAEEAIQLFEAALRRRPDFAETHNNLGNALARSGRTSEAIGHYRTSLQIRPDDPATHFNLGNALFETNQLTEAANEYRAAIKLKPAFPEALNNLGSVWFRLGKLQDAREQFEAALQVDSHYRPAQENLEKLSRAAPMQK